MNLSGKLHSVSAEVVHGDGVVPVAEVVLLTRRFLLPPHAEHGQQHSYRRRAKKKKRELELKFVADLVGAGAVLIKGQEQIRSYETAFVKEDYQEQNKSFL